MEDIKGAEVPDVLLIEHQNAEGQQPQGLGKLSEIVGIEAAREYFDSRQRTREFLGKRALRRWGAHLHPLDPRLRIH